MSQLDTRSWSNSPLVRCWIWLFVAMFSLTACKHDEGLKDDKDNKEVQTLLPDGQKTLTITLAAGLSAKPEIIEAHRGGSSGVANVDDLDFKSLNPGVATVDVKGNITGVAPGETIIRITHIKTRVSVDVEVIISSALVTRLLISPTPISIIDGMSTPVTVSAVLTDGKQDTLSPAQLEWQVDNKAIATVGDQGGSVTGGSAGRAVLTVKLKSAPAINAKADILVETVTVTALQLTPAQVRVPKGMSTRLSAVAILSNGREHDLDADKVEWTTDVPAVATVDKGVVKGEGKGKASITARFNNAHSASSSVTITNAIITGLKASNKHVSLLTGQNIPLSVSALLSDDSEHVLTGNALEWRSVDNKVAIVDSNGSVTAVGPGTVTMTATLKSDSAQSVEVEVVVTDAVITALQLPVGPHALIEGYSKTLTVNAVLSNGHTLPLAADQVRWTSDDPLIASVNNLGVVTGAYAGTVNITATLKRDRTKRNPVISATTSVSVTRDALVSLFIQPSDISIIKGEEDTLKLYGKLSSGIERELLRGVSWSSKDSSIVSITGQGRVNGINYGTAMINASYQGYFGQGTVSSRVTVKDSTQLDIYPDSFHILPGKTEKLSIRTFSSVGAVDILSEHELEDIEWNYENNEVAYVDKQGILHAKKTGSIKASAKYKDSPLIDITINVHDSASELAYYSGNPIGISDEVDIYKALGDEISRNEKASPLIASSIKAIYKNNALKNLSWKPNEESYIFSKNPFVANDIGVLLSSNGSEVLPLAHIGLTKYGKFAHFSHLPISSLNGASFNSNTAELFSRTLGWLVGDISGFKNMAITISGGDDWSGIRDYDTFTTYINELGKDITYNKKYTCNNDDLLQCATTSNSRLIVIFTTNKTLGDIDKVIRSGIPVLLVTSDRHLTAPTESIAERFSLVPVKPIKGSGLNVVNYDPENGSIESNMTRFSKLFSKLQHGDFDFDINSCSESNCNDNNYHGEFYHTFSLVKDYLTKLDVSKFNPFLNVQSSTRGLRVVITLGDHLRQEVRFPVPRMNVHEIIKAMIADGWTYNSRLINPRRMDVGNYGPHLVNILPDDKLISHRTLLPYRSLGVSAIPGKTFTITRIDNEKTNVSIFMNAFREGATKEFGDYNRPKYLNSPKYKINPGESITLTSSIGGSLYVTASENDRTLSFKVTGIAPHPTYKSSEDFERFVTNYHSGSFNWFDIVMPNTEWHIRKDRISEILDNSDNIYHQDFDLFIEHTEKYLHGHPRVLAAQFGPGIPPAADEVTDFAKFMGVALRHSNYVQHFNNDQPNCGSGCSGNPIDSEWTPDPLSHGHIHELGHNLERGFMLEPFNIGHSMTNWFVYYSQTQKNKSAKSDKFMQPCGTDDYHDHFIHYLNFNKWLSEAAQSDLPHQYMNERLKNSPNYQISEFVMTQLIMLAENQGGVKDGWNIIPRLYLHNDLYNQARKNQEQWYQSRQRLGFANIDYQQKITHNDYLVVGYSTVMQLNLSDYFYMLGFDFNREMVNQALSSSGYKKPNAGLYTASDTNLCMPPYLKRDITVVENIKNVAFMKPVTSSTENWPMTRAVDGDYSTHAETQLGSHQWIQIDLEGTYTLRGVRVINFNNPLYAHRFKGTVIQLLNESKDVIWSSPELDAMKFYQKNYDVPEGAVRYIRLYKEDGVVQTTQIEAFAELKSLH